MLSLDLGYHQTPDCFCKFLNLITAKRAFAAKSHLSAKKTPIGLQFYTRPVTGLVR
jgi:hypothetical protein